VIEAFEQAIAIDSVAETSRESNCRLCQDLGQLAAMYFWWDSLGAAERTANRYLRVSPSASWPHWIIAGAAARAGDSAKAYAAYRRYKAAGGSDPSTKLTLDLLLEDYEELDRDVRPFLASSVKHEWDNGAWSLLIALRNQGRLREAYQLHRTGSISGFPGVGVARTADDFNEGILTFERGDGRASAAVFAKRLRFDMSSWAPGYQARHLAWNGTLQGMGLAAVGDTITLRVLADSVEKWGRGSAYGRDRRAHHYLRGLVLASARHHDDAAREFQSAMSSPTNGFTRVNYELARCLLELDRPREAVAALQPALRGEVDASNLYITRTELHELLARAFDRANVPDSAAAHYRAVLKAWRRADPSFQSRRDAAQNWLAHHPAAGN
jgi:tetratricopeptide (TPR) repeat protein